MSSGGSPYIRDEPRHSLHKHAMAADPQFLQSYCSPLDWCYSHGIMGICFAIWLLAIGLVEYCQYLGAAIFQFVVTYALGWTQLALFFLATIIVIWLNVWVDTDISRLDGGAANSQVSYEALRRASRARFNVGVDTAVITFGLFLSMFQVINENTYLYGTPIKMLHGSNNPTTNLKTYNHPLPYYGATFDPYTQQQVAYRNNIHFFNVLTDWMVISFLFGARIFGIIVSQRNMLNEVSEMRHGHTLKDAGSLEPSMVSGHHQHDDDYYDADKTAVELNPMTMVSNALGQATLNKAKGMHGINA